MRRNRGNALIESIVALAALAPFVAGVVLLGKQLDIKHKTYDALRYSVWERTVWSADTKATDDITLETLDRSLGHPLAGVSATQTLRSDGVSRNPFWEHNGRALLLNSPNTTLADSQPPSRPGYALVPALAHGSGPMSSVSEALQLRDLDLNARAFATARLSANVRPLFAERGESQPLIHVAQGAVLSDVWSSRNEGEFRRKADDITADELVETLEMPGRPLAMQAPSKGGPLYGEGQYGWDPDLRSRSNVLPAAYVTDREDE